MNMNRVEVINNTSDNVDIDKLKDIALYTLKRENIDNSILNVIIIDNEEIHKINREYRGIDRPTDVISFALEDDCTFVSLDITVLGDIYISIDKVYEQAKLYNHSVIREISFLTVHGVLHLLGYDHIKEEEEKIMFDKQRKYLDELDIKR